MYELMEIMRHKDISTTIGYVHLIPDRKIRGFEEIANMTPEEFSQAWDQLEYEVNMDYADDPEES